MKRLVLFTLLVSGCALAMEKNPAAAAAITPASAGANAKPAAAAPANVKKENKKGCLARAFVCCNGKTEKN
jgi:hypothetical protein